MGDNRINFIKLISSKLSQWKKLGRILQLEEQFLEKVEKENLACNESTRKVIEKFLETHNGERNWLFWKNYLSQINDDGPLVIREIEDEYPMLLNSEHNELFSSMIAKDDSLYIGQPYQQLTYEVLSAISSKLSDWKTFGKRLKLTESYLKQLEKENLRCKQCTEKVMNAFLKRYIGENNWLLWKKYLSEFDNGMKVIREIEAEYPTLLNQYPEEEVPHTIRINDTLYIGHPYFGITNKDESFTFPNKEDTEIGVNIGGKIQTLHYQEFDEWKQTQDRYLKIYNSLNNLKAIDFISGSKKHCRILDALKTFLHTTKDNGFATKGYHYAKHYNLLRKERFSNEDYNQSYTCLIEKDSTIIFFTKCKKGIKKAMKESYKNIALANTMHPQVKALTQINVIICDNGKDNKLKEICNHCKDNNLYVHEEIFESFEKFKEWYENVSQSRRKIINKTTEKSCKSENNKKICELLKKEMITYEALETCFLPSFATLPNIQLKELEKVLLLSPTQFEVLHSDEPFVLLRGAYGSGKSFILCKKLEIVVTRENDADIFFLICNDQQSGFIHYLKLLKEKYPGKNIIICKSSDFIGTFQSNPKLFVTSSALPKLSVILNHIKNAWRGKTVHVFIDEFCAKYIDIDEVDTLEKMLHSFNNCRHLFVALQSMEEKLLESRNSDSKIGYEIDILTQKTRFKLYNLDYSLRSTSKINTFVKETANVLESEVILLSEAKNYIVNGAQVDNQLARELTDGKDDGSLISGKFFYNQSAEPGHSVGGENIDVYFIDKNNVTETNDKYLLYRYTLEHIFKKYEIEDENNKRFVICTYNNDLYNAVCAMLPKMSLKWMKWTSELKKFISDGYNVLITDYGSVRGFEFEIFIFLLPLGKEYMRYRIVQCLTRATMKLSVIVDNFGLLRESTDLKLVQEWKHMDCVEYFLCKFHKLKNLFQIVNAEELQISARHVDNTMYGKIQKYPWSRKGAHQFQDESEMMDRSDLSVWIRNTIGADNKSLMITFNKLHGVDIRLFWDENKNNFLHYAVELNAVKIATYLINECNIDINSENDSNETPLHVGAKTGSVEAIELLLQKDANLFVKNNRNETPFFCAAQNGFIDVARLMVKLCANNFVLLMDAEDNYTPLHVAAFNGHCEVVEFLLDNNGEVNKKTTRGETPLDFAMKKKHSEVAQLLIIKNADIEVTDKEGRTPFFLAANYGLLNVIKVIARKYGRNKEFLLGGENNYTPLHGASFFGHLEVVKELLNLGADVNVKTNKQYTPLHRAVAGGHLAVCEALINRGADVNCQNNKGDTPLHFAYENAEITGLLLKQDEINIHLPRETGDQPIHFVSYNGNFHVTKLLIERGADVNSLGKDHYSPLYNAVCKGDIDIVHLLVENKANVNFRGKYQMTPLFAAARLGRKEIIQLLMNYGADTNLPDDRNNYPLHEAVSKGYEDIARFFLENNADVNLPGEYQKMPIYIAARRGFTNITQMLLDRNAKINISETEHGNTPLYAAVYHRHQATARLLIDFGAAVNLVNNELNTPLIRACFNGDIDIAAKLIQEGADINITNKKHLSPLHVSAEIGHKEIVQMLVENNADVHSLNERGATPIHNAAFKGYLDIVKILVQYGSDINSTNRNGFSPLHDATFNGYLDVVIYLLNHGADLNLSTNDGRTPLNIATKKKFEDISLALLRKGAAVNLVVEKLGTPLHNVALTNQPIVATELIKNGADINSLGGIQRTPLHSAAYSGSVEVARLLIKNGAEVNKEDKHKNTPLHDACFKANENMIRLLLKCGANVNLCGSNGNTPLHNASYNGYEDIALLLIENGARVNYRNNFNEKPLDIAIRKNYKSLIKLLERYDSWRR